MLQAKDLMIGDYVLYQGHPNRVYRILPATVPFADIGRAAEDLLHIVWNGVHEQVNVNYVEPIPLTPEILEKNGFYLNGSNEDGEMSVNIDYGKWCYENEDGFDVVGDGQDIKYVHQLQHCLKMVGIDKEIVL